MLKKIILTLLIMTGMSAYAADNFLNSVVIDNADGQTNVILRSDKLTKVRKEVESSDRIILYMSAIEQSPDINTLYKNATNVNGVAVQSLGNNDLKIYLDAKGISKANIVLETPDSSPITIVNRNNDEKVVWSIISLVILFAAMSSAKKQVKPKSHDELIKEREMALYRNFQKEVDLMPSMNYKLKSYKKHVLKGETLRYYNNNLTKV